MAWRKDVPNSASDGCFELSGVSRNDTNETYRAYSWLCIKEIHGSSKHFELVVAWR